MFILLDRDGVTCLREKDDLRSFKLVVLVDDDGSLRPDAQRKFGALGWFDRSGYAWIDRQAILQLAGDVSSTWLDQFNSMVDFARTRNWVDPVRDTIRAHVERLCPGDIESFPHARD